MAANYPFKYLCAYARGDPELSNSVSIYGRLVKGHSLQLLGIVGCLYYEFYLPLGLNMGLSGRGRVQGQGPGTLSLMGVPLGGRAH